MYTNTLYYVYKSFDYYLRKVLKYMLILQLSVSIILKEWMGCDKKMNMDKSNYEKYLIKDEKVYCLKCGEIGKYKRFGYVWCEQHKEFLDDDPEDLENIVIDRLKELGI